MAGISTGGFEEWLREATREMRLLRSGMAKARVPRSCISTQRPNPTLLQPGTPLFETDTNRTVVVNADQTGFVNMLGAAV